jgi:subtilisin family serine protease
MKLRRLATAVAVLGALVLGQLADTAPTNAGAAVEPITATQLIVRVDPAVTTIQSVNAAAGTTLAATSVSGHPSYLVDVPPSIAPDVALAAIEAQPGVDFVVPNTTITPPEVDQSRIYAWRIYAWSTGAAEPVESQYAAASVNLTKAQQLSNGSNVTVAVIDTGVQFAHPALAGALLPGWDFVGNDPDASETLNGLDDDGDGQIDEGAGHGTHVAGIVHRVAPAAKILPVRALDDDGSGTMWNVTEGMYWAANHGAKIVNLSLGTHGSAKPLRVAVTELAAENVLVVAAAGNNGRDRAMFPAAAPEAIAVGSVGTGDVVSTFSNFGNWIDVMAPGENIHSTYAFPADGYAMNSGTSMATPWVAGEAALIASLRPSATIASLTTAIKAGATNIDHLNPPLAGKLGAGRIDIAASLRAA